MGLTGTDQGGWPGASEGCSVPSLALIPFRKFETHSLPSIQIRRRAHSAAITAICYRCDASQGWQQDAFRHDHTPSILFLFFLLSFSPTAPSF